MATAINGIWTPTTGTQYTPIEGWVNTLAASIESALNARFGSNTARSYRGIPVASASERNAAFPSPQNGDAVYRTDLSYEEWYYSTTYAAVAGWYPAPGYDGGGIVVKGDPGSWTTTGRQANVFGTAFTLPAGRYRAIATTNIGGPTGAGDLIMQYGNTDIATIGMDIGNPIRTTLSLIGEFNHGGGTATISLDVLSQGTGTKTMSGNSTIAVEYRGPRK